MKNQLIAEKVREYLKAADLARARSWNCAAAAGLSEQTFRRRLREEGARYSTLLADEKRRRALDLLAVNPRADTQLVAKKWGLRHRGNAGRAFKQLFGVTMRQFKRARA